jgi:hypothetical protein
MEVIFWNEFPEKVDWKEAKKLLNFKTAIYVAVKTRKEYESWNKRIKTKGIEVGAWPKLDEKEGYWFSGFITKEAIDRLKQFDGLKMKIDIEPPFPGKRIKFIRRMFTYLLPFIIRKGKNNKYLEQTIRGLKGGIIISGLPLPGWVSRRYGDVTELGKNMEKNFIGYTTLTNKTLMRVYMKWFAKRALKEYGNKSMFALGCTGTGIFGDENTYKSIKEFREDLKMMKEAGAKKIVIFNIEGIMERKDRKEWIEEIRKITYE